jgi:hypothetical protein
MKDVTYMLAVTGFLYSDWFLVLGVRHSLKDRCTCLPCVVSSAEMQLVLFWMFWMYSLCIIFMP